MQEALERENSEQEALLNLAGRMRKFRREIGWTQKQLGAAVRLTAAAISEIETGKRAPRPVNWAAIERVLDSLQARKTPEKTEVSGGLFGGERP